MNRLLPILRVAFATFDVYGQVSSGFLEPSGHRGSGVSAVDANGIRHYAKDYPEKHAPWIDDNIEAYAPHYPYGDRVQHNRGQGLYRLRLDLKTGTVSNVTILRSTGVGSLDGCALSAFR